MALAIYDVLLTALQEKNTEAFESILKRDGLPGDNLDYELLIKALGLNDKSACHLLLDNGCSVCEFKQGVRTRGPLHRVVGEPGWYDVVQKILNCGARVSDDNASGYTALHSAFCAREVEACVVELLLNRFLDETVFDLKSTRDEDLRCIHIASARASVDCIKRCLTISSVNAQITSRSQYCSYRGYSPLHFAVVNDRLEVADFLCQNNADIYVQDSNGCTPIHLALELRKTDMIDILFRYDNKWKNYANRYGLTHFMAACAGSDVLVVERYLRAADDDPSTSPEALMSDQVPRTPRDDLFRVRYYDPICYYPFADYSAFYFAVEFFRGENLTLLFNRGAYCRLKNFLPICVDCHLRRGVVLALIRNHYIHCSACKELNFSYKWLACSDTGCTLLDNINREYCTNRSCVKIGLIFAGILVFIGIFVSILLYLDASTEYRAPTTYEKSNSFSYPKIHFIPKYRLYRPVRY